MKDLVMAELKAIEQRVAQKAPSGLRTGFDAIDRLTGGLQPGGLVIIAARPSMGKSALAAEILANVSARGDGAGLLFSLEMTAVEQAQRRIASESNVHLGRLRSGALGESDFPRMAHGVNRIFTKTEQVWVADKSDLSITELRAYARSFASRHKLAAVAVDYMQLVLGDGETREQEVASISRGLKALAMELRVPVIALSQLNRAVEQRQDKRPLLSDLRESGALEQDAHQVMLIYRDDYYNPQTNSPGIAEIGVAKNRNGPTGMVKLRWRGECTRFEPLNANEAAA
jgi:replicative DNA helicase